LPGSSDEAAQADVRHESDFANELSHEAGSSPNDLLKVAGDLPGHGEQSVRVFTQLAGEGSDLGLRRRRLVAALDLAQVRRFDPDTGRYLANGIGAVTPLELFATSTDMATESGHL
jgi:hypothetical protein